MTRGWKALAALALLLTSWRSGRSRSHAVPINGFLVHVITHPWLMAGAIGLIVAISGLLVVVSGVVPIKASSGHWRITAIFLDFAKTRSVATHSLGIQPPILDDPALVVRGAGHYESGCRTCHGGPGAEILPVMAALTPPPPELADRISRWNAQELFSIVKHGIKFTGMPAWPARQRDDEVWAMVAFLRRLPKLDAKGYQTLVYGEPGAVPDGTGPRVVRNVCWRCHGVDGTGRGSGAFPSLAGQRADYLYSALQAFVDRSRFSGIMSTIAASLSDQEMREVAAYYEGLPPRAAEPSDDTSTLERGATIASRGIPHHDIPSCADCHGPDDAPKNPAYPKLAGQHARYLRLQLELFREGRRGGSGYANLMHVFVGRLGPEQVRDVTTYYASLQVR